MENLKEKLTQKLKDFCDDKDFVLGVVVLAGTPENYRKVIDFMDSEEGLETSDIIWFAFLLNEERKKQRLSEYEN